MPTTSPAPVRVAECRRCGQLFAVYATEGEVACPACEATSAVASLEIVELGVATLVTPRDVLPEPTPAPIAASTAPQVEAPAALATHAPAPADEAVEEPAVEAEPKRSPTVAEWLLQSEQREAAPPRIDLPADSKRSLADSLGWKPGSFRVDPVAAQEFEPEDAANHTPKPEQDSTADSLADFRFDFGATPLSEQIDEDEPAYNGVALELSSAAADAQPLRLEELGKTKRPARGWVNFIGMAAGLMMIAGPAAYLATTWDGFTSDAPTDVAARFAEEPIEEEDGYPAPDLQTAANDDSAAPKPFAPADPFLDSSTKPASFEKEPATLANDPTSFDTGGDDEPQIDLPPSAPREVTQPATATIDEATEPEAPPTDPFLAQPPAMAATEPAPMTAPPADDRYPSSTPAEPAPFDPSAGQVDAMVEPAAAFAEPRPLAIEPAAPQVGLVNAPTYGPRELAEVFGPAEGAAQGFGEGTLADPAQVSAMGQHYARLCHLAQVLTLLDTTDPTLMTAELQAADIYKRLFRNEKTRAESRQIAGPWIAWTGRPHGGVFFAGVPEGVQRVGEVVQYQFRIGEELAPIVMAKPIDMDRMVNSGAVEVGVIGVVVENPREWIAGYEGDAERVVWVRKTLPLARAEQP